MVGTDVVGGVGERCLVLIVEFRVVKERGVFARLLGKGIRLPIGAGCECEAPVVEHLLGSSAVACLDAEVSEHGIGPPTAQEADAVRVDSCTEEGGGSPRSHASGRAQV